MAIVTLVVGLVSACTGGSGAGTNAGNDKPVPGGTLDVGLTIDITSLDPYDGMGDTTSLVLANINGQLFKYVDNKMVPALGQGVTRSADGKTATIALRKGAKFSDGTPITPEDVVFSIQQAKAGANYGSLYKEIIASEKASGDQVVLTLSRPTLNLEAMLSIPQASIIPANFKGKSKGEFFQQPVGAGPYLFSSRQPGVSVQLKKNPNYWDTGKPYIDTLEFKVFNSNNALTSAYQAKSIQAIPFVPTVSVPTLTGAKIVNTAGAATEMFFINGSKGPLSDLKVRQAISTAIDRETIVKSLRGPGDKPTETYVPASVLGSARPASIRRGDIEAAKQLLAASSYKDGATLKVIYPTGDDTLANTVQSMQAELAKIGIKLDLQAVDQGVWVNDVLAGKYELAYQNISAHGTTADAPLQGFIATKAFGGGWTMDVAKTALTEYQGAKSTGDQAAALDKFQNWINAELPVIPTVSLSPSLALSGTVAGYQGLETVTQQALPFDGLWLTGS
ncbi:ABC transporter substrate-binding protein [Amycolatopsis orientalis]|uniref:ABC transporter substrate-binding protein n=1 Tax=Amycolatopsis orientalis TaxID=31958 RepID=UPI000AD7D24D|nr:ABC transporter substrate-binding protein [Amycolatopsis orientalis]